MKERPRQARARAGNSETQKHTLLNVFPNQYETNRRADEMRDRHNRHRQLCSNLYGQQRRKNATDAKPCYGSNASGEHRSQCDQKTKQPALRLS